MEINEFPKTMERLLSEQQSAAIMSVNASSRKFRNQAQMQIVEQRNKEDKKAGIAMFWGTGIGVVVGFFACTGICLLYDFNPGASPISGVTWVACVFLGDLGGALIGKILGSNNTKNIKKYNQSINEANILRGQQADEIRNRYDAMKNSYRQQFMEQATSRKARFASSEVAEEIYQWLFSEICRSIETADRGNQAEQVDLSFSIGILSRAVRSDFGMYDFAQHQVAELVPLDQTALAYVFYERLQGTLRSKYPKDISGAPADIRCEVKLTENVANILITYRAANDNRPK